MITTQVFSSQQKKIRQEKQRRGKEKKGKGKVKTTVFSIKPKHYLTILLSAHAQTSEANILHLDQKALNVQPVSTFVASFKSSSFNQTVTRKWLD